jgi:hypothetical protein
LDHGHSHFIITSHALDAPFPQRGPHPLNHGKNKILKGFKNEDRCKIPAKRGCSPKKKFNFEPNDNVRNYGLSKWPNLRRCNRLASWLHSALDHCVRNLSPDAPFFGGYLNIAKAHGMAYFQACDHSKE